MGRLVSRRLVLLGGAVLVLATAGLVPSVAAAPTSIYLVQGLPDRTVSVSVDGTVVDSLDAGEVSGPFPVASGTRTVTVSADSETLVSSEVQLDPDSSSEIVIHLPASPTGDPMITRFADTVDTLQNGRSAQSVAHVAAAGPIDIRVGENVVSANLANGEYTYKVVPAGASSLDIVPAGRSEPLLGPFDNTLMAGTMNWVFVVGVPGQDLAIIRHTIDLGDGTGSERPADVRTGTGGQAAEWSERR
jgi:hypothetical protein